MCSIQLCGPFGYLDVVDAGGPTHSPTSVFMGDLHAT